MTVEQAASPDGAEESNDLVPLLLGAMRLLDAFAAAADERSSGNVGNGEPQDGVLVAAALGLLSLRRTLLRWAHVAADLRAAVPPEAQANPPATPPVSLR